MDAIVLVGGQGTRLRPLTYDIPKQMLPVVDRPMIEHVAEWLAGYGVDRIVLSLGYRADKFIEAFPEGELAGARLVYAVEPEPLDTAGAVLFAASSAGLEKTFIVLNADVISDSDLSSLVSFHHESGAMATIQLTPVDDPSAFGVVPTASNGRVSAFIEKPPPGTAPTNKVNAGCYVIEPAVLGRIPSGRRVSIEHETFPALVAAGSLYALVSDAYWLDTGTPRQYLQASLDVLSGLRTPACLPSVPRCGSTVFVDERARVEGNVARASFIGPGAFVERGADISDSVVSAGTTVASGARVSGSMLMEGANVGAGAVVESCIIGPGASVGAFCKLSDYSVIGAGAVVEEGSRLAAARVRAQ
ncbi:MAG: sugar phosphate nucleotidyltransferase [Acidimicrobiales bacterium]